MLPQRANCVGSGKCLPKILARRESVTSDGCLKECLAFGPLGAIFGAGTLAFLDSNGVQSSAHHMVADPREVLDTPTADQNDGVFLQVVSDSGNVGGNLDSVGEADTGNFAKS